MLSLLWSTVSSPSKHFAPVQHLYCCQQTRISRRSLSSTALTHRSGGWPLPVCTTSATDPTGKKEVGECLPG